MYVVGKHLHAFSIDVPGSVEAYAVDGSPADSVIVALRSDLLSTRDFALIVSGINRGDNAGLHVIYSGTVGAAREGACSNYPALALSLDSHSARSKEQYEQAAQCSVAFIKVRCSMLLSCGISPKHCMIACSAFEIIM